MSSGHLVLISFLNMKKYIYGCIITSINIGKCFLVWISALKEKCKHAGILDV